MDTFMDKLAQKFTAQEMIKANSEAEAEEIMRLKEQVQEYSACLDRMKEVCRQIEQAADGAQEKIGQAVDGAQEKLGQAVDGAQEKIGQTVDSAREKIGQAADGVQAKLEDANAKEDEIGKTLEEIKAAQTNSDENVHRECVRSYRNVQAVVTEESTKQIEALDGAVKKLAEKQKSIMGVSVAALIVSLAGVVFQVLVWLHII